MVDSEEHHGNDGYEEIVAASTLSEIRAARRQRLSADLVVAGPSRPRVVLPRTSNIPATLPHPPSAGEATEPPEAPLPSDEQRLAAERSGAAVIAAALTLDPESRFELLRRLTEQAEAVVSSTSNISAQPQTTQQEQNAGVDPRGRGTARMVAIPELDREARRASIRNLVTALPETIRAYTSQLTLEELRWVWAERTQRLQAGTLHSQVALSPQPGTSGTAQAQQDQSAGEDRALGGAAISEMDPEDRIRYLQTLVDAQSHTPLLTAQELAWVREEQSRRMTAGTSHHQVAQPPQPGTADDPGAQEGRRDTFGVVESGPAPQANSDELKTNGHAHDDEDLDVEDDVPRASAPP